MHGRFSHARNQPLDKLHMLWYSPPMNTADRLRSYYPFDDAIVETVTTVAEAQHDLTLVETLARAHIPEPKHFRGGDKSVEVLDIIPPGGYDQTQVFHLTMAGPIDPDRTLRAAILAAVQPATRIIMAGNPAGPGKSSGKLALHSMPSVWRGDLRPTIDPTLRYLDSQAITSATHVGGSFGADKAATAAGYADRYGQDVPNLVSIDPASVKRRSLLTLAKEFRSTEKHLDEYTLATDSRPYFEARSRSGGSLEYRLGLLRPTNLAIAHALTLDGFGKRVDTALTRQPDMRAGLLWGVESELAIHGLMLGITAQLKDRYSEERVSGTPLPRHKHAMLSDPYFHAAMVLHGLKPAAAAPEPEPVQAARYNFLAQCSQRAGALAAAGFARVFC